MMKQLFYFCLISQIFVSKLYCISKQTLTSSWYNLKGSRIIIKRHEITLNPVISNLTFWHNCDGSNECVVNCVVTSFLPIVKMKLYLTVKLPENERDNEFRLQVLRTVIDVEKLLSGVRGAKMLSWLIDDILKAIDFEPKFPLPPVGISNL